jgi:hypothetical protein
MEETRQSLATGKPLDFLAYVSTLLAALDPRAKDPFERARQQDAVTVPALVGSFAEVELPETTALLAALAVLGPDELSRARARRAYAVRPHMVPDWLARLDETLVDRAVESTHVLGDGENVMLNVRLPGYDMTMVVYIDHNLGTVVKDGFPAPADVDGVVGRLREASDDPDLRYGDIPLADARARISEAMEKGGHMFPPLETETWPASRPLAEWLLRLLPEGGTGYARPQWSQAALRKLANRFFGSPFGRRLDNKDNRNLLDQFLWFGTDYGPGDPLRWSPVAVEILMADWIPRKIAADPAFLAKAPALLREFIRYCHDERGIRPSLTQETLAAVNHYEPDYQRAIRSPRPQGPEALLAAMGLLGEPDDVFPVEKFLLDELADEVGGYDVLDSLDDEPLPDEEFAWGSVPEDARDQVQKVLDKCDECADSLLGPEYGTACRRLLARAARGVPGTSLASAKPELAAAAVCWVIGRGNHLFGTRPGELKVKDLTGYFTQLAGFRTPTTDHQPAGPVPRSYRGLAVALGYFDGSPSSTPDWSGGLGGAPTARRTRRSTGSSLASGSCGGLAGGIWACFRGSPRARMAVHYSPISGAVIAAIRGGTRHGGGCA